MAELPIDEEDAACAAQRCGGGEVEWWWLMMAYDGQFMMVLGGKSRVHGGSMGNGRVIHEPWRLEMVY